MQPAAPQETGNSPTINYTYEKKPEGKRSIFSTIFIICGAVIVALLLTTYVFQSYQVDGPSMEPTLHNGDRLIIWKAPRTLARFTNHSYIPQRGDIIVFVERGLLAPDGSTKQLIKRVIALPGERVAIRGGEVIVFNDEHPDGFTPDTTMPYGEGISLTMSTQEGGENITPVPKDSVYVLGDNRGNSMDSRSFGPIPVEDIVGKLSLRILPLGDAKKF